MLLLGPAIACSVESTAVFVALTCVHNSDVCQYVVVVSIPLDQHCPYVFAKLLFCQCASQDSTFQMYHSTAPGGLAVRMQPLSVLANNLL